MKKIIQFKPNQSEDEKIRIEQLKRALKEKNNIKKHFQDKKGE